MTSVAERVSRNSGAALIFDYGYSGRSYGDTLQAVQRHEYVSPLHDPGRVDVSAHVDFSSLKRAALARGTHVWGPAEQGRF